MVVQMINGNSVSKLPASPPPFPALKAGVNPGCVPVYTALPTHPEQASQDLHDKHNRNMDHPARTATGNVHGQTNSLDMETASAQRRGSEPARPAQQRHRPPCLRANRNLSGPQQSGPWGSLCATTGKLKAWNQHDLHNRGIDYLVYEQTEISMIRICLDHGEALRHDREAESLEPARPA